MTSTNPIVITSSPPQSPHPQRRHGADRSPPPPNTRYPAALVRQVTPPVASPIPEAGDETAHRLKEEDLRWLAFADDDQGDHTAPTSPSASSIAASASLVEGSACSSRVPVSYKTPRTGVREEALKVICEWIHDDRSSVPLQPWRHEDAGKAKADGPGLYPARRLSNGDIHIRHFPGQWTPCWRVCLCRPALPPQCFGCCGEQAA
ncbi:unnamed protein product [Tilletia laevis]|uniref:Uncharacterized protein n=2 Tax=Tilletia TaxID=13289 RepID=A0A8X7SXL6_9BASI|nr:hypothetical protein CF328_g7973 [Tilletia controversa]KAE8184147.1 hypothetical protein CF335_g8110 [Tilletia laevis]KAE8241954.1 hypothetical protein A4X03_0g8057 [Tilletia caries]KAE8193733.1 hypothetical protein CF336_g3860 [Tilletia laevis]KAE8248582.1 hypothetical protein A4X06_0g3614 [Tilletia controversa]